MSGNLKPWLSCHHITASPAQAVSTCIRNVFFIIIMIFIIHYNIIYVSAWWEITYLGLMDTPQPAFCGKNPSGFYFSG